MGQMPESDDHRLLAEFVRDRSETAFTELVRRYAGLVHSTAFRFCGNPHHAEEITQAVFVILARKAETLSPRVVVSGWLYQTARLTAANFVKGEMRRRRREQEAVMQSNLLETGSTDWGKIAPLLDDAMGALGETDRNAVLLRYFENRTSSEIGVALRMNEETARKRVNRALEKLRHIFVKRGVTVSSAALSGVISANSVQPISAFMVKSISAVAVAKGAAASTSTLTLIKGALKIMAWTKMKTAIVVGVGTLLTFGTATLTVKTIHAIRASSPPDIQGSWEGTAAIFGATGMSPGEKASSRIVFQFFKTNGAYTATGVFIDTSPDPFQVANFTYDFPSVRFAVGQNFTFEGKLRAGAMEIAATQRRGNLSVPMVLKRVIVPNAVPEPLAKSEYAPRVGSDLQGTWNATLGPPILGTRVAIKIAESSSGNFRAELDNLSTSWLGQPVAVTYNPPKVKLQVVSGAGMFQGELRNGKTELAGNWIQGGGQTPVVFSRADR
ncbi:MAG: sigma-70 family RNA polymerase sigma factor [Verrucomicrobiota bacterium]|jgi:RNA polymerase sigma factor (sigma-70 family)